MGDALSVEAKHEEKSDNKFVSRQFSRKYTLPKGCDASMVTSNLSSDGILESRSINHVINIPKTFLTQELLTDLIWLLGPIYCEDEPILYYLVLT